MEELQPRTTLCSGAVEIEAPKLVFDSDAKHVDASVNRLGSASDGTR